MIADAPSLSTLGQIAGTALMGYGLVRNGLALLAEKRSYNEGRYDEGPYGGGLSGLENRLVSFGVWARLLPEDQQLTLTDRKRNTIVMFVGLAVLLVSMLIEL